MYAIYDPNWVSEVVPNLPNQYWEEYVKLLADFAPVPLKNGYFSSGLARNCHVFPFVDVWDFDYEKFYNYKCFVKKLMCEAHGLSLEDFL